jgi:cytochrome c oxidase cbb3-type subunit III
MTGLYYSDCVYHLPQRSADMILPLVLALTMQSAPAPARDIQDGKKLFDGMCARCHGIDGTGDEGPALNRAVLSRATSDDALREVIRDGIPDRGMPRVRRLTETELQQIVAYVRSLGRTSGATRGDAARGRAIYARLGCASCHIVDGLGGSFGPELTQIGAQRGAAYLKQSVVGPAENLPRGLSLVPGRGFAEYLPVQIVTADGKTVRGARINEDPFTIQIRDTNNQFHSYRKSELKQVEKEFGKSLMPGFRGRVNDAELDDLVAYLSALGGVK